MIGFSPDYNYVMTANEGEPRDGVHDPAGSVTIIDLRGLVSSNELTSLSADKVKTVGFDSFDARRAELIQNDVLLKPGVAPSLDLEPEYIAYAGNGKAFRFKRRTLSQSLIWPQKCLPAYKDWDTKITTLNGMLSILTTME